jgi:hypothetical protein
MHDARRTETAQTAPVGTRACAAGRACHARTQAKAKHIGGWVHRCRHVLWRARDGLQRAAQHGGSTLGGGWAHEHCRSLFIAGC